MAITLVSHGGTLLVHGGQLVFFQPDREAALHDHGRLSAVANSKQFRLTAALHAVGGLSGLRHVGPTPNSHGVLTATARSLAIAYDATGSANTTNNAKSTLTWSHTAAAGASVFAVTEAVPATSAVTVGGKSMRLLGSVFLNNSAGLGDLCLWGLIGCGTGSSQTIIATLAATGFGVGNSVSYQNVGWAATPATVFGAGTSLSQTATCSAGQWILQAFGDVLGGWSPTLTGGTNRYVGSDTSNAAMTISDATANTTFTAAVAVGGGGTPEWASIDTVLTVLSRLPATLTGNGVLAAAAYARMPAMGFPLISIGILSAVASFVVRLASHGGLTATTRVIPTVTAALHNAGALTATAKATRFILAATLHNAGAVTATANATRFILAAALHNAGALHATAGRRGALHNIGVVSATAVARIPVAAAITGRGVLTARAFAKITETNVPRVGQTVPAGTIGCFITLIGAGGGGGLGAGIGFSAAGGGSGGGGASVVSRSFIPVGSLGSVYSVTVPSSTTAAHTNGADAVFSSNNGNSVTAGGGKAGVSGAASGAASGGAGGTTTVVGFVSITNVAGTAGGAGANGVGPVAGVAGTNSVGAQAPGGGGGAGRTSGSVSSASGKGGDSITVAGGVGRTAGTNSVGGTGTAAAAGLAGGGGGGGGCDGTNVSAGGPAGTSGAGGGGGSGGNSAGGGGTGSSGYTLVEWV